jgi:hypothetical protein
VGNSARMREHGRRCGGGPSSTPYFCVTPGGLPPAKESRSCWR